MRTASPGATFGLTEGISATVLLRTVILETVLELFCTFLIILGDLSFIGDRNDILYPTRF